MWILVISLLVLATVALILGSYRNRQIRKKIAKGELESFPEVKEVDGECCGQHAVCEKESLLAAVSKKIEYYDDEELDQFIGKEANAYTDEYYDDEELDEYAGIPSDKYTEEQIEKFRDVFYTMQETDVAGWNRSLQLRGINLPDELKDEVFLVVGERRFH